MKLIKSELCRVLIILAVITLLSGIGYSFVRNIENQILEIAYIAIFYMPTPLYSLIVYSVLIKKNLVIKYLKNHNLNLKGIKFVISIFLLWVVITVLLTAVLSNIFPNQFSGFVTNNEQVLDNIREIGGDLAAENTNLPPSPLLLIPVGIISSLIAGFTLNMVFALGEEVLWRGYMWDKLQSLSLIQISLIIGFFWGLWHWPLILQGYNYGSENVFQGAIFFIIFCMAFSMLFTMLMNKTGSTVLAGSLHGMFNAFAGVFLTILITPNPFMDGSIGVISILSMLLSTVIIFFYAKRKEFAN